MIKIHRGHRSPHECTTTEPPLKEQSGRCSTPNVTGVGRLPGTYLDEPGQEDEADDRHELDQDVERRTGGVLEGIADRVADDRSLVGVAALAAHVATFDTLLGVVPGAARVRHEDRLHDTHDESSSEQATERMHAPESRQDRSEDRDDARDDHLLERAIGRDLHAACGVRLDRTLHDVRVLAELTTDLLDHDEGRITNGTHGERTELVRQDTAEKETDHDLRVVDVEGQRSHLAHELASAVAEGVEQSECRESGRTDGEALADGRSRVADGVKRIRALANFTGKLGHLSEPTGVVSDRTVGVDAQGDAEGREHTYCRDGDAVHTGHLVGDEDRHGDEKHRRHHGIHPDSETVDDVGRGAGLGVASDGDDRFPFGTGVVLRHLADEDADDRARRDGDEKLPSDEPFREGKREAEHRRAGDGEDRSDRDATVKRMRDLRLILGAHEERAHDGREDPERSDSERQSDGTRHVLLTRERERAEDHGRDDRTDVGLEQVSAHASYIADVVADVVRDGGRVPWIVFGDARLDLADEVRTDVGGLGEDSTADTREQSDGRSAEAEAEHVIEGRGREAALRRVHVGEEHHTEKRETDHAHAHDAS